MAGENEGPGAPGGQAPPPAQPPVTPPTQPVPPPALPAPSTEGSEDSEAFDEARAKALIAKLRAKEKAGEATQKELEAAKAELAKVALEKLTDLEKAQARAQAAEDTVKGMAATMREVVTRSAVERIAAQLGLADPSDALALMDRSLLAVDDQGIPTNAKEVLEALVAAKPYLKPQPPAAAGTGRQPPATSPTNPPRQGGKPTYAASQLRDLKWQTEHRAEFIQALNEGRVDFNS